MIHSFFPNNTHTCLCRTLFSVFGILIWQVTRTNGQTRTPGKLNNFANIGLETTSNDEPRRVSLTSSGTIFVSGTTTPFKRGTETDLGNALHEGLRDEDVFIAKLQEVEDNDSWQSSVFRLGSAGEDRLYAMLVTDDGDFTYLAGAVGAALPNSSYAGQSDLFVVKLDTKTSHPAFVWPRPIVLGTIASEAVTALASDPARDDVIYGAGYSTGGLFRPLSTDSAVQADAILFAFSVSNGSILAQRQFGSSNPNFATAIIVSSNVDGPIFVSVVTEERYGNFKFGNFHLYKFSRDLEPLGDVLLRSYSRESVLSFAMHPMLRGNLFAAGTSWLDEVRGYDIFLKRVIRPFDNSSIGSEEFAIDNVGKDQYTKRYGSRDNRDDFTGDMVVHPESGRVFIGGNTQGAFTNAARRGGVLVPFIVCIDPINASITHSMQEEATSADSWVELAALTLSGDGNAVFYASKVLNETTNQFFTVVGAFDIPSSWLIPISVPLTPSPTGTPLSSVDPRNSAASGGFPIGAVVIGVCGGIVAIVVLIIIVVVWMRISGKHASGPKLGPRYYERRSELASPRRDRIIPKYERDVPITSGLV